MTPPAAPDPEFRQVGERVIHQSFLMTVVEGAFEAPDGTRFTRDIVRHPGAVGVVAVDGDEAVMVRQYRPVMDRYLLEIPAGTRDKDGENPRDTAVRELAEEIGATADSLEPLIDYWVAPGISDEHMYLFVARGLRFGDREADGPEEQHMSVERLRMADVPRLVADGTISDAKSVIGLLLVATGLTGGAGPA